ESWDLVRTPGGHRPRKQALDVDLGRRDNGRPPSDTAAPIFPGAVDLARGTACVPDLSSKPHLELSAPLPLFGIAGEYSPQPPQSGSQPACIFWGGNSLDASNDAADLAGGALVLPVQQSRQTISCTRLGMGFHCRSHSGFRSACILPVPGVSDFVCGWERDVRILAGPV